MFKSTVVKGKKKKNLFDCFSAGLVGGKGKENKPSGGEEMCAEFPLMGNPAPLDGVDGGLLVEKNKEKKKSR